jgi:threonine dehydrogenase-like Zn-dependent dehydrogenase
MGFTEQPIIDWKFIGNNVTVKGKFMYERDDMIHFVKVLERGLFPKGKAFVDTKTFGMEDWKLAFDTAAEHTGIGKLVVISP